MRIAGELKKGLASGPDGYRPDNLLMYLTMAQHGIARPMVKLFFKTLASVCNLVISGTGSEELRKLVIAGILYPVGESPRPIIVDSIIAKLSSKVLVKALKKGSLLPEEMTEFQQAFNDMGIENIVFSHQAGLDNLKAIGFKLDIKNGFNSLIRAKVEQLIRDKLPDIQAYLRFAYGPVTPIHTLDGLIELLMERGFKQGDPLVPFLFCFSFHQTVELMKQKGLVDQLVDLKLLMDDMCIVAEPKAAYAVAKFLLEGEGKAMLEEYGLVVHPDKIFVYWPETVEDVSVEDEKGHPISLIQYFSQLCGENFSRKGYEVMGVPIGSKEFVQEALAIKLREHQAMLDDLKKVPSTILQFQLLRDNLGVRLYNHLLRTLPPTVTRNFTAHLRDQIRAFVLSAIDSNLEEANEACLILIHLKASLGGFGIPDPVETAAPAFLAATAGRQTLSLDAQLEIPRYQQTFKTTLRESLVLGQDKGISTLSQRQLIELASRAAYNRLMTLELTEEDRFRIQGQAAKGASSCFLTPVFSDNGLVPALNNEETKILVRRLLGLDVHSTMRHFRQPLIDMMRPDLRVSVNAWMHTSFLHPMVLAPSRCWASKKKKKKKEKKEQTRVLVLCENTSSHLTQHLYTSAPS